MKHCLGKGIALLALLTAVCSASARDFAATDRRQVDLVLALDVSGSMGGLIDSARQRLWDIVNDLGQATPQADLRVAVLSFGRPAYGQQTGYVRVDQALTSDLDAVNRALFAFGTSGGREYVARAIQTAVEQLDWSQSPDALKLLFVAGNESALQDPQIDVEAATRRALDRDIVVNTLYCGGADDTDAAGWQRVAGLSQGVYASIDQNAAAVASVATPQDQPLAALNAQLNATYVPYGAEGQSKRENQLEQDANVANLSAPAAASRTVTKGSSLYDARQWDLIDAVQSGIEWEALPDADLPPAMQAMDADERSHYMVEQTEARAQIRQEIGRVSKQREDYLAERAASPEESAGGLDQAISKGLRAIAEKKGLAFERP